MRITLGGKRIKKEKICGIYCYTNKQNGKKYVGQSKDILERKYNHTYLKNKREIVFEKAIRKYGIDNFDFEILIRCIPDQKLLDDLEKFYIKYLHSHISEWGYNIAWGGGAPMTGRKHSQETKDKVSKTKMGTITSEETKIKLSKIGLGRKSNKATKSKFVGVYWNKKNNNWNMKYTDKGKNIHGGTFYSETDAALEYNKK
jgi:group I intron endonuclease